MSKLRETINYYFGVLGASGFLNEQELAEAEQEILKLIEGLVPEVRHLNEIDIRNEMLKRIKKLTTFGESSPKGGKRVK